MADTINTQISRIETAKSDIKTAIIGKGVTVPNTAKISDMAGYINQIYIPTVVTYYTGTSAPASTLGSDGDIYLQTE